jgi:probable HAF family extracellular repeat protein
MKNTFLAIVFPCVFFFTNMPAQAADYAFTDLGTLGGTNSYAADINNNGVVVGTSSLADGSQHAFVYRNGGMHDLGTLGGTNSTATAINSIGDIVGWSDMADGSQHAFFYDGTMHDLETLGGSGSWAYDINDKGQIVGAAYTADGSRRAFLYSGGVMQNIDTFDQFNSSAYGINNKGQIVGAYTTFLGHDIIDHYSLRAFFIGDSGMEDLGIPSFSEAHQIFDNGTIFGIYQPVNGFIYTGGAYQITDILWSDINVSGQMVGSEILAFPSRAVLSASGTLMDLNDLIESGFGGILECAGSINDYGQIVGDVLYGDFLNGTTHAFLLTSVPEPSMLILLAGAIVGIMGINLARYIMMI